MYTSDPDVTLQTQPVASTEITCHRLFHDDFTLHVNMETRIVSLLHKQPPSILTQQQFTRNEWMLLIVLLSTYPYYASHEMLLSSITPLSVDECRKQLQEVRLLGAEQLRRELKPVYRALCGIRAKLIKLHPALKVSLVRDVGYLLIVSF